MTYIENFVSMRFSHFVKFWEIFFINMKYGAFVKLCMDLLQIGQFLLELIQFEFP